MTIDYTAIVTQLTTGLGTAVTAAMGVAASVLVARMGWKFFKGFVK